MRADDAWCAVAELAASQHGAFQRRQAADRNLSNRRLARAVELGELRHPEPDVFTVAATPSGWHQRLMVQTLTGRVISHRAAAALHGFDGFGPDVIETVVERNRYRAQHGTITHCWEHLDRSDLTVVDRITCTNVAVTLAHLGAVVASSRVEQALDSVLRMGYSPAWLHQTLDTMWRPGATGLGVLRDLLDDPRRSGPLPDSWFERLLERLLSTPDLPAPELQWPVRTGSTTRRIDLAYPAVRLGVAGHSRRYHFGPNTNDNDHQRDLDLAAEGWELVYVTWTMASDPVRLARSIATIHRVRQRQLGPAA